MSGTCTGVMNVFNSTDDGGVSNSELGMPGGRMSAPQFNLKRRARRGAFRSSDIDRACVRCARVPCLVLPDGRMVSANRTVELLIVRSLRC